MTRTRLAAWNSASLLLFTAVTLAVGLVTTPVLVRWLGRGPYGAGRVILEYYGYLALLELGLGGALGPLLARAAGRDDAAALRGTLAAGVRAYLGVALAVLAVGLALAAPITWLIPVGPAGAADLRRAWLVGLLGFPLLMLTPFRALAEARQRGYLVNLLMTAQALVVAAASLALAYRGWGITGQVAALVLGNAVVILTLARAGLRDHPGLLRAALAARPDPEAWRALWRLSPPALLINLCGRIGLLTDGIVVALVLRAPAAVTTLSLAQRLAVLAQSQLQGVGNAAWAGLAELHARGEDETFRRRLVELTRLIAVLGVAALGPIVAYNRYFVTRLWVPSEPYGGDLVVAVAAVNALLIGLTSLWIWCLMGTGRAALAAGPIAASSAINLAASVALTYRVGLVGPLLGTTIAYAAVNAWVFPLLLRRAFGVPLGALARAVAGPVAWGVPYAAALWWLARSHEPARWVGLAAEAGSAAAAFLGLAWGVLLGPDDRAVWRRRLAHLWPSSRRTGPPVGAGR